jgi:hypothetical protein
MIAQQPPSALAAVTGLREPPGDIPGLEGWGLLLGITVLALICSTRGASGRGGPGRGRAATLRHRRISIGIMVLAVAVAVGPAVLAAVTAAVSA